MNSRFHLKALTGALALALAACGGGSGKAENVSEADLKDVAARGENKGIEQVAPPAGVADWTQSTQETPEGGFRIGNPEAQVKVVEYGSIGCGACAAFSVEGSRELIDRYVKSGRVSLEFRPVALFPSDPGIYQLLKCQGPQPFFTLIDQLYATQREWIGRMQTQEALITATPREQQAAAYVLAGGLDQFFRQRGMPASRVQSCLADQQSLQQIVANSERYRTQDGIEGTPTFFLNGQRLENVLHWNNAASIQRSLEPRIQRALGM